MTNEHSRRRKRRKTDPKLGGVLGSSDHNKPCSDCRWVEDDDLNNFLEEFKQGKPKRLIILNTGLYALAQFILYRATDIRADIEDFAKQSPQMLPFILNGPRSDIIPQPKLPWTPGGRKEQSPCITERICRKYDQEKATKRRNETGKDRHFSLKPTSTQEKSAGVQASKQDMDLLEARNTTREHVDVSVKAEDVGDVSTSAPKTPPGPASAVRTYSRHTEQQPASSVATMTPQSSGKQVFTVPAGFQFTNNGSMGQPVQYGVPTHPQLPFFPQYPFGQPQPLSQTIAPSPIYLSQFQSPSGNGSAYFFGTPPGQQWGSSPIRHESNPHANAGFPIQPQQSIHRVHASQFNRSV
ncbi:uncharacterized protein BDV14DRAFT_203811 [Aspergillus stella-maris]|uniref:uncharacterized protein n=1 Tax=Aspergillus stella-maris TaxID=1810926 RepID=UPI003CCD090D